MLHLLRMEYTRTEQDAAPHIRGHVDFLERHHAAGTFLVSGQTVPSAEGGLIIAAGVDRAGVERIIAEDPFVRAGVGRYTITTVDPRRAHPAIAALLDREDASPATS
ncbi:YciI family protein [Actinomadura terrae]|uniref:YciI family protein n=1 Tax=Actinomadura terrae TaxID=604353 RepID=UPI001FA796B4|nr:YciI family protein [Actinomadura terrae]